MDSNYYSKFGLKPLVINVERSPEKYDNSENVAINSDLPKAKHVASPEIKTPTKRKHNKIEVFKTISIFKKKKRKKPKVTNEDSTKTTPTNKKSRNLKAVEDNCSADERDIILSTSESKAQTLSDNHNNNNKKDDDNDDGDDDRTQTDSPQPLEMADSDLDSSLSNVTLVTYDARSSKAPETSSKGCPCENCQRAVNSIIESSRNSSLNQSEVPQELLSCPFTCSLKFPTLRALKIHISASHLLCNCKINSEKKLTLDFDKTAPQGHAVKVNYECVLCRQNHSTYQNLERHLLTVHEPLVNPMEEPHYLNTMPRSFLIKKFKNSSKNGNNVEFGMSGESEANETLVCMICLLQFSTISQYLLHSKTMHKPIDFLEFWDVLATSKPDAKLEDIGDSEDESFEFYVPAPKVIPYEKESTILMEKSCEELNSTEQALAENDGKVKIGEKTEGKSRTLEDLFENIALLQKERNSKNAMRKILPKSQSSDDLIKSISSLNLFDASPQKPLRLPRNSVHSFDESPQKRSSENLFGVSPQKSAAKSRNSVNSIEKSKKPARKSRNLLKSFEKSQKSPKKSKNSVNSFEAPEKSANSANSLKKSPKKLESSDSSAKSLTKVCQNQNQDAENSDAAIDDFLGQIKSQQDEMYQDYEFLETVHEDQVFVPSSSEKIAANESVVDNSKDPYEFPSESPKTHEKSPEKFTSLRKRKKGTKNNNALPKPTGKRRKTEVESLAGIKVVKNDLKSPRKRGKLEENHDPDYAPGMSGNFIKTMKETTKSKKKQSNVSLKKTSKEEKSTETTDNFLKDRDNLLKILGDNEKPPELAEKSEISQEILNVNLGHQKCQENMNSLPEPEQYFEEFLTIVGASEDLPEEPNFLQKPPKTQTIKWSNKSKENFHIPPAKKPRQNPVKKNQTKRGNVKNCKGILQNLLERRHRPKIMQNLQMISETPITSELHPKINKNLNLNVNILNANQAPQNPEEFMEIPENSENSPKIQKSVQKSAAKSKPAKRNRKSVKKLSSQADKNVKKPPKNTKQAAQIPESTEQNKKQEPIFNFYGNHVLIKKPARNSEQSMPTSCPQCNRVFPSLKDLAKHFYLIQPYAKSPEVPDDSPLAWNCAQCKMPFKTLQLLYCHRYLVHNDESMIHICENCCQISTTINAVNQHQCSGVETFTCRPCDKNYRNAQTLAYHNRTSHQEQPGPHVCPKCQKPFLTNSMMTRHSARCEAVATEALLHKCNMCKIYWKNVDQFLTHVHEIHSDTEGVFCRIGPATAGMVSNTEVPNESSQKVIEDRAEELQSIETDENVQKVQKSVENCIAEDTQDLQELETVELPQNSDQLLEDEEINGEAQKIQLTASEATAVLNSDEIMENLEKTLEKTPEETLESAKAQGRVVMEDGSSESYDETDREVMKIFGSGDTLNLETVAAARAEGVNVLDIVSEHTQGHSTPVIGNSLDSSLTDDAPETMDYINGKDLDASGRASARKGSSQGFYTRSRRENQERDVGKNAELGLNEEHLTSSGVDGTENTDMLMEDKTADHHQEVTEALNEQNVVSSGTTNEPEEDVEASAVEQETSEEIIDVVNDVDSVYSAENVNAGGDSSMLMAVDNHETVTETFNEENAVSSGITNEPEENVQASAVEQETSEEIIDVENDVDCDNTAENVVAGADGFMEDEAADNHEEVTEALNEQNATSSGITNGSEECPVEQETPEETVDDENQVLIIDEQALHYLQNFEGIKVIDTDWTICPQCAEKFDRNNFPHHFVESHDCYCAFCRVEFEGLSEALEHKRSAHGSIDEYVGEINRIIEELTSDCDNSQGQQVLLITCDEESDIFVSEGDQNRE